MIKTTIDIVKEGEYYIELNSLESGDSILNINLNELESFPIKWDPDNSLLLSPYGDFSLECPDYCVPILTYIIIKSACTKLNYPEDLVIFRLNDRQTPGYITSFNKDDSRVIAIFEIISDIIDNGMGPHHVELARENDVWDGFKCIIDEIYKVDLQ